MLYNMKSSVLHNIEGATRVQMYITGACIFMYYCDLSTERTYQKYFL